MSHIQNNLFLESFSDAVTCFLEDGPTLTDTKSIAKYTEELTELLATKAILVSYVSTKDSASDEPRGVLLLRKNPNLTMDNVPPHYFDKA